MFLEGKLHIDAKKFKSWNVWEHPLYEISEHAFKQVQKLKMNLDDRVYNLCQKEGIQEEYNFFLIKDSFHPDTDRNIVYPSLFHMLW